CLSLVACNRKGKAELEQAKELTFDKPEAALVEFAKAKKLGADVVAIKKGEAAARESLGQNKAAEELLREVLAAKPDDLEALIGLSRLALRQQKLVEARAVLEKVLTLKPPHVPSVLLFSALAQTKREADAGLSALESLSGERYKRFRESAEYVVSDVALRGIRDGSLAKELQKLDRAASARPFNAQVALALASGFQAGRKDLLAEWLLQRVSESASAPEEAHVALAELALQLRHVTTAEIAIK